MRVIFLTASPKRRGGASRYFASLLRLFLPGAQKTILPLRNRGDFSKALSALEDIDALCLCFPLYVDALPSHLIEFLALAEAHCREHACHFRVYALGNNGFIEGRQNRPALRMLRAWCERANLPYGGGIGIGGGAMLRVLGIVYPILLLLSLAQIALALCGAGGNAHDPLLSLGTQLASWLFFNAAVLVGMARLACAMRKGREITDFYARVLLPAFLFIPIADLFMVLSSAFQGRFLFALCKRDVWRQKTSGNEVNSHS